MDNQKRLEEIVAWYDSPERLLTVTSRENIDWLISQIRSLRALIRVQETDPPFDVADDQTTEMAVKIAELQAQLAKEREEKEQVIHRHADCISSELGCFYGELNDRLNKQLDDIESLQAQLRAANEDKERLKAGYDQSPFDSRACPGCNYEAGKFIAFCGLHSQLRAAEARVERLEEALTYERAMRRKDIHDWYKKFDAHENCPQCPWFERDWIKAEQSLAEGKWKLPLLITEEEKKARLEGDWSSVIKSEKVVQGKVKP